MVPGGKRRRRFGARGRQRFLDALALTCSVARSAAHADVAPSTLYDARREDPAFAAQWQAALEEARLRLEALVLEHGGAGLPLEGEDVEPGARRGFDLKAAIEVLKVLQRGQAGTQRRGRAPAQVPTREESTAAILKQLEIAERRMARKANAGG